MARRLLVTMAAFALGCASGNGPAPSATATPTPYAAPPAPPSPPSAAPARQDPRLNAAIRYGPSAVRYVVYRHLHVQQMLGDQAQAQDIGARLFVSVAITGPADSAGYPTTFTVDSIVGDSGTPPPIADNLARARKLVFTGRTSPRGDFAHAVASDTTVAQSVVQLLGNFRDFLPRLPADGLKPGAAWTDTLETTQQGSASEVSRHALLHGTAGAWEDHGGRALRLEMTERYEVAGSGKNAGQPFELSGTGTGAGTAFLSPDGRYLGGEWRDSTSLLIRLPVQGVAVPVIQVARATVAVLP